MIASQLIFFDIFAQETSVFFKDTSSVNHFIEAVLPSYYRKNPNKIFRIWVAGCASGEQVYTLGIACQYFREIHPGFDYRILGTDQVTEQFRLAKRGLYPVELVAHFRKVSPELFHRYMHQDHGEFCVVQEIKNRIAFRSQQEFERIRFSERFDFVFMGNALVHLSGEEQKKIIHSAKSELSPHGFVSFGDSKRISHLSRYFQSVRPGLYRKEDEPARLMEEAS